MHAEIKNKYINHFFVVEHMAGSNKKLLEVSIPLSWYFFPHWHLSKNFSSSSYSSVLFLILFSALTWCEFFFMDNFSIGSIISIYRYVNISSEVIFSSIYLNSLNMFSFAFMSSSQSLTCQITQCVCFNLSSSIFSSSILIFLLVGSLNFTFL